MQTGFNRAYLCGDASCYFFQSKVFIMSKDKDFALERRQSLD